MKLVNHTLKYLSLAFLGVIGVWALVFYFNMLDEIYDSIDDGLDNYKLLILKKALEDSTTVNKIEFGESNYMIREVSKERALVFKDVYKDTLMYMEYEKDLEPVRMLTTVFGLNGNYYELRIASSMVEEDDLIEDLVYALIWLYVLLIVTALLINNIVLRRIWKPFYTLLDNLRQYRIGKEVAVAQINTPVTEFRQLHETIDQLLKYIHTSFNSQKQFTENASHELQTPLAIAINKLELLMEKDHYPEEGQHTVGQVIRLLERLTRLNKSLLLLTKIENKQYETREHILVNNVVTRLTEEFSDLAEFKRVTFDIRQPGKLSVEMNVDLCSVMLSNLIKNAITHNIPEGHVSITILDDALIITNTGTMEPLDPEQVFLRFHKGASTRDSTGLGLAIVKTIADLYGIRVTYQFTDVHAFRLVFPTVPILS